ncbi:MAG TPA: diguanylate cyclase [Gaiellaceae bacterium]|nr:diguanylate cyclase [Gaiellaceae bacterium]
MGSFKLKLVVYFSVISLLPFAAAFSGLEAVTDRNETRRVDGILETGVRAGLSHFADELSDAQRRAAELAASPAFQRALARRDRGAIGRMLSGRPDLRVETGRDLVLGAIVKPAVERTVVVKGSRGPIGRVVAGLPVDDALAERVRRSAGIGRGGHVAFVRGGWITAGSGMLEGRVGVPTDPNRVTLGGRAFRALASEPLPDETDLRLLVLAPQARIDESTDWAQSRIFFAMLIVLVLIAVVAYLEGRSIVRNVAQVADAARGIARGRLGDRVGVRGRDEFASLARAFNEMADQLEARLRELEEERRRVRETTLRFGEALAATHDLDQLLPVIVESAVETTGASRGQLVDDGDVLIEVGDKPGRMRLEFPLVAGREKFGSLILSGDDFKSEQRESAGWLVGHAVIALSNAQRHQTVEQQALVDGLTGLANRRLCTAALEKELARAQRFGEPLALVLTDIDDFKRINDRWGHPTGDQVLRVFADTLRGSVRGIDLAGRWGGEEFALLLPGTDLDGGRELAERVRRKLVRKKFFAPDGERIRVTASFGVAAFPDVTTQDELVAASDEALYDAKRSGKNRVAVAALVDVNAPL